MKPLLAAITIPVALLFASPAFAGVDEFVDEINKQNVDIGMYNLQRYNLPLMGLEACNRLRGGMTYEQALASYPAVFGDGASVIRNAQRTICPDTLH
jgi:hypothetical protein